MATVRAEEGAGVIDSLAPVSTRIDLGGLSDAAVADLAAEAGLPDQADAVSQRTRGHTLFVVETLRALAAGTTGIPESLEAAVLARVRRAGQPVEAALRARPCSAPRSTRPRWPACSARARTRSSAPAPRPRTPGCSW